MALGNRSDFYILGLRCLKLSGIGFLRLYGFYFWFTALGLQACRVYGAGLGAYGRKGATPRYNKPTPKLYCSRSPSFFKTSEFWSSCKSSWASGFMV